MKDTLYKLTGDYKAVLDYMETVGDLETADALFDTLDAIDENLKDKAESIGDIIRSRQAEAAALKAEADRLKERAARASKEADKLMDYMFLNMNNAGFTEVKGLKHTFKIGESISLKCEDPLKMPKHFQKVKIEGDIAGFKKHLQQKYEEKEIKLVSKYSTKPKMKEILYTDLDLSEMGLQFVKNRKLNLK